MANKSKYRIFWLVWGLGAAALTIALIQNYTTGKTLEPLWIMAIAHSYASTAIIAGLLKQKGELQVRNLSPQD
ncbi:MAG: hypothetical protein V3R58_07885 [candidate division NC10 bacterium]